MKAIPEFRLSTNAKGEASGITNVVVIDATERAEMQSLVETVREFAEAISAGAVSSFYIDEHCVPTSFLDRLAEVFNRCQVIFVHRGSVSAGEDYLVKFWATLDASERDVAYMCMAILIAQGRLEMCLPEASTERPTGAGLSVH